MYEKLLEFNKPVVVDADALNLLAERPNFNDSRILTPHSKEAGRLLGEATYKSSSIEFRSLKG